MLPLLLIASLIVTVLVPETNQLPNGAPESVCSTLLPNHGGGIPPQRSAAPYRIIPSATGIAQGQTLRLEIEGNPPELNFGGFMVHARSTSGQVVGRFAPAADGLSKLINCNGLENTVTHTNANAKPGIGVEWQAPNDFVGEVIFNATVAQDYGRFWVGIQSEPVQVVARGANVPNGISTTRRPITSTAPSVFVQKQAKAVLAPSDPIYEGCHSSKGCFGFPDGCVNTKTCNAIATVIVQGERYQFEMKTGFNNPAYIAIGLSTDDRMGQDSVMECVPEGGTVRTYASWTEARPYSSDRVPANYLRLVDASYVDGVIYCKVERDAITKVEGQTFDLIGERYHLLLATGSELRPTSVSYHDIGKIAAGLPRFMSDVSPFTGASVLLLRLHGAFMLTAWIGTASIGILIARYFKQTWVGSQLCGKDQWFAWHRIFMVITWLLTMAGFVIIFVEIKGWSQVHNPHAILGVITTALCFFQPIGAIFRPAPNSKNRPFFNWGHWLGGNLAHILAIVTIFFAVKLAKAELPEWLDWILVAFVAFHVVMHFIFSIAGCASDRRNGQRVNSFPMNDMSPSRGSMSSERKQDAAFSGLRKILLTVYLVVIILFVVALVCITVLAPIESTVQDIRAKIMN